MRAILLMIGAALLVGCARNSTASNPKAGAIEPDRKAEVRRGRGKTEMIQYPSPASWKHANDRQRKRAIRSFDELKQRSVPVYSGPLFVEDDEKVTLQSPQEVARRTLVLLAVELRAEGMPQKESLKLIDQLNLWSTVSPEEKRFLLDENPDPDECRRLVWRLESIWVLLWALGFIDDLTWPSGMCDVPKVVKFLKPFKHNPEFIIGAKLRSKTEILDAQGLIMRIHWAIRDAALHKDGMNPDDLDWSQDDDWTPVNLSHAVGVIEQRHYTLNWLVKFLDPKGWDDVDTPT